MDRITGFGPVDGGSIPSQPIGISPQGVSQGDDLFKASIPSQPIGIYAKAKP